MTLGSILRRAVETVRPEVITRSFARLLVFQASGAAGDALLALALADSLFFSVPEASARGRVALYLVLTMAPFAVVVPLLSRVLDRHRGSLRTALAVTAVARALAAWILATRLASLLLFPLAFALLVLSRGALVMRAALLPRLLSDNRALVDANSSLSRVAALAGATAVVPGVALLVFAEPRHALLLAALVYVIGAFPTFRLPAERGVRSLEERMDAQAATRSMSVRQAVFAIAGMRLLVGFLIFHLAFASRREGFGSIGLGLLIAGATVGAFVGAVMAPRVRARLTEEGILAAMLTLVGVAGVIVGRWFGLGTAVVLVFTFGIGSGAAKVAFDSIVQRATPEGGRGWAFARFEARLQLAWVAGALIPLAIPLGPSLGVVAAGVVANLLGLVFVLGRHRTRPPIAF